VFLLIPCGDCASIFISRFIFAPSWFRGMKTPRIRSESLSHGTLAFSVSFVMVSFPGGVVTVEVTGVGGFSSSPCVGGFSVSSFIFWAISFRIIWVSPVSSRKVMDSQ